MTNHIAAEQPSVDQAALTTFVRQQLQDETATITNWSHEPLAGGLSGSAVHRFQGEAETTAGLRSWSLIRKSFSPANGSQEPEAYDYWQREVALYQSGLLDTLPVDLIVPRCFGIEGDATEGYQLWLEDMGAQENEAQWPLAQYGIAAHHLGQFNGAYLVGRPLPDHAWLRKPDVHQRLAAAEPGIGELPTLREHPLFAPLLAGDHVERIQQLWAEREQLLAQLEQLPWTFCHRDAFHRNLFIRDDEAAQAKTVALDWGSCGLGMLGEELVPLFAATLKLVVADTNRLAEMDETIFHGYIAGLRDAGWQGEEQLVRFGFTALTALKVGVAEPATKMPNVARRVAALPPGVEPPKLLNPGGYQQTARVDRYLLGLGEEACRLCDKLR